MRGKDIKEENYVNSKLKNRNRGKGKGTFTLNVPLSTRIRRQVYRLHVYQQLDGYGDTDVRKT